MRSSTVTRMLDTDRLHDPLRIDIDASIADVIDQSSFAGPLTRSSFEATFARRLGRRHAVAVGSHEQALTLALLGAGIGPGDEVLVPALAPITTGVAVVRLGAVPVFTDVDRHSLLISEEAVQQNATPRTKAMIATHLFGHPVPFDQLAIHADFGLAIVEDGYGAAGAAWQNSPVGTVGQTLAVDVSPAQLLGALGSGGVVLCDEAETAADVARYVDHGRDHNGHHVDLGVGHGLDGIHAAVLSAKLPYVDEWLTARRRIANYYYEVIDTDFVPWSHGASHDELVIRVHPDRRDQVIARLAAAGVESTTSRAVALSAQLVFAGYAAPCDYAEHAAKELVSVPVDPTMSDADIEWVADVVNDAL